MEASCRSRLRSDCLAHADHLDVVNRRCRRLDSAAAIELRWGSEDCHDRFGHRDLHWSRRRRQRDEWPHGVRTKKPSPTRTSSASQQWGRCRRTPAAIELS